MDYDDIGTSPLYTLKTVLEWAGSAAPDVAHGSLLLIVWTLIITTSIKYVGLVTRAGNDGEGGILALMARLALKGGERRGLNAVGILLAAQGNGGFIACGQIAHDVNKGELIGVLDSAGDNS